MTTRQAQAPKVSMGPREAARPACPAGYQATVVNGTWRCLRVQGAPLTTGTQYGLTPRRFAGVLEPVTTPRGAGPLAGVGRALGALTAPFRTQRAPQQAPLALSAGLGAVDLTNADLMAAAQSLYDWLGTNGCQVAVVPAVHAFQAAWIAAGGTLPNDSGGRSPVDGYYGANTAAALQQMFNDAPAGCVGAAPSGGGPVAVTNPTQSVSTAVLKSQDPVGMYFADLLGGGASLWWTLGIVGIVAVVAVSKPGAFKMYPGSKRGPKRAARKGKARKRSKRARRAGKRAAARKGGKKRRRNPAPPPFSRAHARHEVAPAAPAKQPVRSKKLDQMARYLMHKGGYAPPVPPKVVADMDDDMVHFNYLIKRGDLVGQNIRYPAKWRHLEPPPDYADLGDQVMETPRRKRRAR